MESDRDVEKTYLVSDFIAELRRLADALESGEPFVIEIDGEEISVPLSAAISVEHERENGSEELEFQLKWGDVEAGDEFAENDEVSEGDDLATA